MVLGVLPAAYRGAHRIKAPSQKPGQMEVTWRWDGRARGDSSVSFRHRRCRSGFVGWLGLAEKLLATRTSIPGGSAA